MVQALLQAKKDQQQQQHKHIKNDPGFFFKFSYSSFFIELGWKPFGLSSEFKWYIDFHVVHIFLEGYRKL